MLSKQAPTFLSAVFNETPPEVVKGGCLTNK